jgi:hypothetical protein
MCQVITRDSLRAAGACYDDERVSALVPPEGITPLEVLDLGIPVDDRIWAVVHCGLTAREARLFAAWCAARALRRAGITDAASWAAVRVAARFAVGRATDADLAAARDAARVDAGPAAWSAAWDAAWFAARSAARSVSGVDARVAEREAQLDRLRVVLGGAR